MIMILSLVWISHRYCSSGIVAYPATRAPLISKKRSLGSVSTVGRQNPRRETHANIFAAPTCIKPVDIISPREAFSFAGLEAILNNFAGDVFEIF